MCNILFDRNNALTINDFKNKIFPLHPSDSSSSISLLRLRFERHFFFLFVYTETLFWVIFHRPFTKMSKSNYSSCLDNYYMAYLSLSFSQFCDFCFLWISFEQFLVQWDYSEVYKKDISHLFILNAIIILVRGLRTQIFP